MSGLKEIRNRINSVTSTRKITSAMKMVSAAKFHKAQETIARFEPYANKLLEVLAQTLLVDSSGNESFWFNTSADFQKEALIVITSNSSMCAGFNHNLVRKVLEDGPSIFPNTWLTGNTDIICLGKKGADSLTKNGLNIHSTDTRIVDKPNFTLSSKLAESLLNSYCVREYGRVFVAYNRYKNPAIQEPQIQQFLPILLPEKVLQKSNTNPDTIYEPSKNQISKVLIPKTMKNVFHAYLLDNAAGENGARMTAMHQATDNASELIKNLVLQYNKARQASITKEILEIVSGAEALKG